MMAAAKCKRQMHYYTFDSESLANSIFIMHQFLVANEVTIGWTHFTTKEYKYVNILYTGALYNALLMFCVERHKKRSEQIVPTNEGLFQFVQLYLLKQQNNENELGL
jgi:hypothetical protein